MKTPSPSPSHTGWLAPLRKLYDWVIGLARHPHALKALAVMTFAEASFFPIPTDPLLLAMAMGKPKRSLFYALITTLFSVLGALFGYFLGAMFWDMIGPLVLDRIFSAEAFQAVVEKFRNHVFLTVFVAGFSPIPFKVFTLAGGVAGVALAPFVGAAILSRGLRYFILGGLVFIFGPKVEVWIDRYFEKITIGLSIALVLFFAAYTYYK